MATTHHPHPKTTSFLPDIQGSTGNIVNNNNNNNAYSRPVSGRVSVAATPTGGTRSLVSSAGSVRASTATATASNNNYIGGTSTNTTGKAARFADQQQQQNHPHHLGTSSSSAAQHVYSHQQQQQSQQHPPPAIPLPSPKCQAFIAIFEDAYEQLAVLADIAPVEQGKSTGKKTVGGRSVAGLCAAVLCCAVFDAWSNQFAYY